MSESLWKTLSKEKLEEIINNSVSYVEVCKKIGYTTNKGSKSIVTEISKIYNIDISHLSCSYNKENLIGQTFGYLKVLKEDITKNGTKSRNSYWFCECQGCENHTIKSICGADLKRGLVTNCGCIKRKRIIEYNHSQFQDLTGQHFGYLTVIEPIFEGENFTNKYKCKCKCGTVKEYFRQNLMSGTTVSCGCLSRSIGEEKVIKALTELKITFKKEYSFKDLIGDKNPLRFDFAIFNNNNLNCLIECQGIQHQKRIDYWDKTEKEFLQRQKYDNLKKEYCKKHQIPLIEISYQDYNKIDKDYISNLLNQIAEN